ncbi:hypothetical protein EKG83_22265 [Saccharothrix syringae]|uniref:Aminoglycoside phosphotransferase domain-containing protein n=2 Tax=Saccharothrix syringae TaxID=103733 RepID=A0A5Q0H278_SACSY|nr:hypothetical protein EKG83_22265 [Saccharothrix syringae]
MIGHNPTMARGTTERVARERGLTGLRRIGSGLEFTVHQARTAAGEPVVLRVSSGGRFQSNANDPLVDTRALLTWERQVTARLAAEGLPVAEPLELVPGTGSAPDVLISRYVPDDGSRPDPVALGGLLARLHRVPVDGLRPPADGAVPARLVRRWRAAAEVAELPAPPPQDLLAALLADRTANSLLHLDVRRPNLRCADGAVTALLDWSNALVGDPVLELGRFEEFARLPDNGLDAAGTRAGYEAAGGHWPADDPALLVHRLDAAVMLAVVFLLEAPDRARAREAVRRLHEVHAELVART